MTRIQFALLTLRAAALLAALAVGGNLAVAADAAASTLLFADKSVLNVDATSLDLRIENVPPREYPHVNYRSHVRFEDAAREWAANHFMLTGNSVNALRITVRKGDIVEKLLPVKKGFAGLFRKDQAAEYEASLEVEMAIVDVNGKVVSSASGKATNSRTVTEGATEQDKQQVWMGLIVAAFDGLDKELLPQVRQVMGQYVH